MRKRFSLAASFLIFCMPSLVTACTCGLEIGTCGQSWKAGEVVFIGKVTGKFTDSAPATTEDLFARNAFRFSVSESFRGSATAGEDVTIYTGIGGGDCGYPFSVGTSYLVYASLNKGKLFTNICTPTSPASRMRAVIRQLRALQRGEPVADLFGVIGTSPIKLTDDPLDIKPLARKRVRVIGSNDLEHSTITDDEGVFWFQDLPDDTYYLDVDPPWGNNTSQRNKSEKYKVEIGPGVSGCPTNITFGADARVPTVRP
jgi:hypothetical protein